MEKKRNNTYLLAGFIVAVGLLFGFSIVYAQEITTVYLPVVMKDYPPTPTPTPTFTPTATEVPTATPVPTSTSLPSGVQILSNYSMYVDSIDYLHIVGEISNNTGNNLRFVRITANLFNGSGGLLDTDFTYTWLDDLPAYDKTCFSLLVPLPAGYSYFQFEAPSYWTDGQPLPSLTVINDSGGLINYGWYKILGQVRNDAGTKVTFVSPVMTLYNSSGNVVDCDFTYVNSTDLEAGQVSSFENTFIGADYSGVTHYRIQVDGN